jgi:hypothetical protein
MPAFIARLLPVIILAIIGFWINSELDEADKRRDELKDHFLWKRLWFFVDWWLKFKRTRNMALLLVRIGFILAIGYAIVVYFSSSN